MTETIQLALIAAAPPTIVAATGFVVVLRKVKEVHLTMNSRLDQLVATTKMASFAEGIKHEQDNPEVK